MKEKLFFWKIKDKINLKEKRCCPPHFWPHKFKFWEKIDYEPCHIHKKKWRMKHHVFFCKYLKCPNYKFMIKEYQKNKNLQPFIS